jgi:NADP-dependent 3-hydroxy acid dehydrogenase YdfG
MGKVIAITGASAGIGRATALHLARSGASVTVCARRRDKLDEVAAEIARAVAPGLSDRLVKKWGRKPIPPKT